jgi:hypothetical protein
MSISFVFFFQPEPIQALGYSSFELTCKSSPSFKTSTQTGNIKHYLHYLKKHLKKTL